ncbi:GntR family transcriptional regulator [Kitasatospora sp. NPDC049285]|uniref:GntR family transcriptional regulator n=1 Tax=Kitasatospora sp. NPDC049285 TaxID=3157096 RepID=UPI00343FE4C6
MAARWEQLAEELEAEIAQLEPGSAAPSMKQLLDAGRGSTTTISAAYRELKRKGLVKGVRGSGYLVRDRRPIKIRLNRYGSTVEPGGSFGPWESALAAQGLEGRMLLVATSEGEAPASVAAKLRLTEARGYTVVGRTRHAVLETAAGDEVVQLQQAWYPVDVARAAGLDGDDKVVGGTLARLAAAGLVGSASERVFLREATKAESGLLDLPPGSLVVQIERLLFDGDDRPVELLQIAADPSRTELVYDGLELNGLR